MKKEVGAYINTHSRDAVSDFRDVFYKLLNEKLAAESELVILCIGTDRATGDSLGPIIGYKLSDTLSEICDAQIYGTLESPVHAKNITETLDVIKRGHTQPFIIAIDASLGRAEHIGYLTMGAGTMRPGAGVNKVLPEVGHISITGIVNFYGSMDYVALQNTRLGVVMKMADVVHKGMLEGLRMLNKSERQ